LNVWNGPIPVMSAGDYLYAIAALQGPAR
jgi:hypothetical protein